MCLLSHHPKGVKINVEHLRQGMAINGAGKDGAGWALTDGKGFLISNRSLDGEAMLEQYLHFHAAAPGELDGVFHSRRTTTGLPMELANTHPFPVIVDDRTALLFHNGTLFPVPADEPRTDSRIYADDGLFIGGRLDDPASFHAADDYISSTGSKVIVVTDGVNSREAIYMFNKSEWIQAEDGAWHSNADFLPEGVGWEQWRDADGNLWRANLLMPGQCPHCHKMKGCNGVECHSKGRKPRERNESEYFARLVEVAPGLRFDIDPSPMAEGPEWVWPE